MSERVISSTANSLVKRLRPLFSDAGARRAAGLFPAEGRSLCREAVRAGLAEELWFTEKNAPFARGLAAGSAAGLTLMSEAVAGRLTDQKAPQGVFALCRFPQGPSPLAAPPPASCAAGNAEKSGSGRGFARIVGLFDIADPINAGAILRTALALGYDGAVAAGEAADLFSPRALRAGMGAQLHLPVQRMAGWQTALDAARSAGFTAVAAALTPAAQPLAAADPRQERLFLVFGNEGAGLDPAAVARCTPVVIPMHAGFDSLNVAVAAGIFMWHFRKPE